jgi:hypothetical protein
MDLKAINVALKMISWHACADRVMVSLLTISTALLAFASPWGFGAVEACAPALQAEKQPAQSALATTDITPCPLVDRVALRQLLRRRESLLVLDQVGIDAAALAGLQSSRLRPAELLRTGLSKQLRYVLVGNGKNDLSLAAECGQLFGSQASVSVLAGGELSLHAVRQIKFAKPLQIDIATALSMPKASTVFVVAKGNVAEQKLLRAAGFNVQRNGRANHARVPIYLPAIVEPAAQPLGFALDADASQIASALTLQQQISAIAVSPPHIPCYLQ